MGLCADIGAVGSAGVYVNLFLFLKARHVWAFFLLGQNYNLQ